jgi:hypothetical protein
MNSVHNLFCSSPLSLGGFPSSSPAKKQADKKQAYASTTFIAVMPSDKVTFLKAEARKALTEVFVKFKPLDFDSESIVNSFCSWMEAEIKNSAVQQLHEQTKVGNLFCVTQAKDLPDVGIIEQLKIEIFLDSHPNAPIALMIGLLASQTGTLFQKVCATMSQKSQAKLFNIKWWHRPQNADNDVEYGLNCLTAAIFYDTVENIFSLFVKLPQKYQGAILINTLSEIRELQIINIYKRLFDFMAKLDREFVVKTLKKYEEENIISQTVINILFYLPNGIFKSFLKITDGSLGEIIQHSYVEVAVLAFNAQTDPLPEDKIEHIDELCLALLENGCTFSSCYSPGHVLVRCFQLSLDETLEAIFCDDLVPEWPEALAEAFEMLLAGMTVDSEFNLSNMLCVLTEIATHAEKPSKVLFIILKSLVDALIKTKRFHNDFLGQNNLIYINSLIINSKGDKVGLILQIQRDDNHPEANHEALEMQRKALYAEDEDTLNWRLRGLIALLLFKAEEQEPKMPPLDEEELAPMLFKGKAKT